ncbi:hypothetical protein DFJ73DRAFT_869957 [Zopfochytrium polystomum]|nr:hypothetical protein DFJ73DRAFT_869957 [Zopfochytrium polystomum]
MHNPTTVITTVKDSSTLDQTRQSQPPIIPRIVSAHPLLKEIYLRLRDSRSRFHFATLCRLPARLQAHSLYAHRKSLHTSISKPSALQFLYRHLPADQVLALYNNFDIDYCATWNINEHRVVPYLQSWKDSGLPLKYTGKALDNAVNSGRKKVIKWWVASGLELKYSEWIMDRSTTLGHVATLQLLKDSGLPLKYSECGIDEACAVHDLDTLRWWKESGLEIKFSHRALDAASNSSKGVRVLNWWRDNGLEFKYTESAFRGASWFGAVEVLQWWKDSGLELRYSRSVLGYAEHTRVLDWWKDCSGTDLVEQILRDQVYKQEIQERARRLGKPDIAEWWENCGSP